MADRTGARLAVLASGRGSNFVALAEAAESGLLAGKLALVVSDRKDAPVLGRAESFGVPARFVDPGNYRTRLSLDAENNYLEILKEYRIDVLLLAGFMRVIHAPLLKAFQGSVLNVHPSLLPAFPGLAAPRQALEFGATVTGCTIHLVDEAVDGGVILAQTAVPIHSNDDSESLQERINQAEHKLYPETVRRYLTVPFQVVGRRVLWEES